MAVRNALVAGATGYLGRHLVRALKARNIGVRALARDLNKAKQLSADDVVGAEVTDLSSLAGVMSGVDSVVSCIGITRQRDGFTYDEVDFQGNANLLKCAQANRVENFLYVSLFRGKDMQHLRIAAAKERFVTLLERSGLNSTVVRPTAFFSDMKDILSLARSGRVFVFGSGSARINPISGRDLADATVDGFLKGSPELNIGGPEVFTYEEIARVAFEALGKRANVWHLPTWTAKAGAQILRAITPVQVYGPVEFFLTVATQDMVAPSCGTDRLSQFFRHPECDE